MHDFTNSVEVGQVRKNVDVIHDSVAISKSHVAQLVSALAEKHIQAMAARVMIVSSNPIVGKSQEII